MKKQEKLERKLNKIDQGGAINNLDLVSLMNDDLLVERYSRHLNNILFAFQEPFLKEKYLKYL